jgi:hypothetical protein
MGWACRVYGRDDMFVQNIVGNLKQQDIDERILLNWILKKEWEGVDWIHMPKNKYHWSIL